MSNLIDANFDDSIFDNETVAVLYASYANACCSLNRRLDDQADEQGNPLCEGVDFFEFELRDSLLAEIGRMKAWLETHPHTVGRCINCSEPQNWQLTPALNTVEASVPEVKA